MLFIFLTNADERSSIPLSCVCVVNSKLKHKNWKPPAAGACLVQSRRINVTHNCWKPEALWDELEKQVWSMEAPPPKLQDLKYRLLIPWCQITEHLQRSEMFWQQNIILGRWFIVLSILMRLRVGRRISLGLRWSVTTAAWSYIYHTAKTSGTEILSIIAFAWNVELFF